MAVSIEIFFKTYKEIFMLPISFKELFFAQITHNTDLTPFPLHKHPTKMEQKFDSISVEWFNPSENGTFVSTLPAKDLNKYDLKKHLYLKACQMRLFIDLPSFSATVSTPLERKNILSLSSTIEKISNLDNKTQETLARNLLEYTTEIGLSILSLEHFRLTKEQNNWALVAYEAKIFQNPQVLHSRECTKRFLAVSLMKSLSKPLSTYPIDPEKLEPQNSRLAPFFFEIKKNYKESTSFSLTKIVLCIVSCGLLPLYYLLKCCWKFYQISRLKKKLYKLTFGKNPYTERAEKTLDCCIKMTSQAGSAKLDILNRQLVEL